MLRLFAFPSLTLIPPALARARHVEPLHGHMGFVICSDYLVTPLFKFSKLSKPQNVSEIIALVGTSVGIKCGIHGLVQLSCTQFNWVSEDLFLRPNPAFIG